MRCPDFDKILPQLQRIGAMKWVAPIFLLLERFAGLEELIDRDEDIPINELQRILDRMPKSATDGVIADALSRMNCFTYRVKSPTSKLWNPLEQSYASFVHAHRGHVRVFQWNCEHPDPTVTQAWLLEQVVRA